MEEQSVILIVEEDVLVRHPLAEYLRECGYKVAEAVGVEEARQLLGAVSSFIDIVLVHAISDTDKGFSLASWIRVTHPGIQVILAGTVAKAADKAGALCEDGPALAKPYDHKLVLDRIRRLRARHDPGNPKK